MRNTLQSIIDNQLRDELNETEHVDEGRQRADNEAIPASVAFVQQRVDRVAA